MLKYSILCFLAVTLVSCAKHNLKTSSSLQKIKSIGPYHKIEPEIEEPFLGENGNFEFLINHEISHQINDTSYNLIAKWKANKVYKVESGDSLKFLIDGEKSILMCNHESNVPHPLIESKTKNTLGTKYDIYFEYAMSYKTNKAFLSKLANGKTVDFTLYASDKSIRGKFNGSSLRPLKQLYTQEY